MAQFAFLVLILALIAQMMLLTEAMPAVLPAKSDHETVNDKDLVVSLRAEVLSREQRAEKLGEISWADGVKDPERYDDHVVLLSNSDFVQGTLRLRRPGVYRLAEDITFNPNPGSDWLPVCNDPAASGFQVQYCNEKGGPSKPFRLGFFAAITIEGDGIVLDLNGNTLAQSEEHALQQRFFSLVELATQPFIAPRNAKPQGPATDGFGDNFAAASHAAVKNGYLGRSAHHGVHGTNVESILIDSVKIKDYEVAAVHINGGHRIAIVDTDAQGHNDKIPVRATYSGGRFLLQAIQPILASGQLSAEASKDIGKNAGTLAKAMDLAKEEILSGGQISDPELSRQFGLEPTLDGRRLVDGNAYGIVLSTGGVVVNNFKVNLKEGSKFGELKDVVVRNVQIANTGANVHEVPTISRFNASSGKPEGQQVDSAGSVVRMAEILNDDQETYKADYLHDLRFSIAWWASTDHGNDPFLVEALKSKRLGTFSISGQMAAWARSGLKITDVMSKNGYEWVCNMDSMSHHQKGVVGLFLQTGKSVTIENVVVQNSRNYAEPGGKFCGNYLFASSDVEKAKMFGYTGTPTRGILIVSSHNVNVKQTQIASTNSVYGDARGVELLHDVRNVYLEDVSIDGTTCDNLDQDVLPNRPARADGLLVQEHTHELSMSNVQVSS